MGTGVVTHMDSHTHTKKKKKNNLPVTTKSATEQRENLQLRGHSIPIVHFLLSLSLSLSRSLSLSLSIILSHNLSVLLLSSVPL